MIDAFDQLLDEAITACAQVRNRDRLHTHLLAQLVCLGQHTVTGLLCTSAEQFRDWSAAYRLYARDRVNPQPLFATVRRGIEEHLNPEQPLVVAMDDSLLRKRGRKIPGCAWRVDPLGAPFAISWVWAQRVIEMAAALPTNGDGAARTIPIDFVQAPTPPRPRPSAPAADWQAYRQQQKALNINRQALARVEHLRQQRQQEGQHRPLWLAVDGRFTNGTMLKNLPADVVLIGRLRADARLFCVPENLPPLPQGGRRRQYGLPFPTPEQVRQDETIPWQRVSAFAAGQRQDFRIKTFSGIKWRSAGARHTLRLIVIAPLGYHLRRGGRILYRNPAYLICTDPNLPIEQILQAYIWRWGIEVNFRDQKTLLGVGQAQVRNPHAVEDLPASAVAAYALLLSASIRAYGPQGQPDSLPLPAWRRHDPPTHSTTAALINALRHQLWGHSLHQDGFYDFTATTAPANKPQKLAHTLHSAACYAIAG